MVNVYSIILNNSIAFDKTTKNIVDVILQKMFTHENTTQGEHRKITMPFLISFTPDKSIQATTDINTYVWDTLSTVGTKPRKNKYLTRWLKNETVVILTKRARTEESDYANDITTIIRCAEHDGLDIVIVMSHNTFDTAHHILTQYGATTMYLTDNDSVEHITETTETGEFHMVHGITMNDNETTKDTIILAGPDQNVDTIVNNFVSFNMDSDTTTTTPKPVVPEKPYNCEHTVLTDTLHAQKIQAAKKYLSILEDRRNMVRIYQPAKSLYMGTGILALGVGILFPTVLPVSVPAFLTLLVCSFLFTHHVVTARKTNKEAQKNFGVYWSFLFSEYRKQLERIVDQWVELQRTPCGEKHDTSIPYDIVGIDNMKKNPFIMLALPTHTKKDTSGMEHFNRQLNSGIDTRIKKEKEKLSQQYASNNRVIQSFTAIIIALLLLSVGLNLNNWNTWALIPVIIAGGIGYGLGYRLSVSQHLKEHLAIEIEGETFFNEATITYDNFALATLCAIQKRKESQVRIILNESSSLREVRTRHNEIVIALNDPETRETHSALTRPSTLLTEFTELAHNANELSDNPYNEDAYITTVIELERAFAHLLTDD